MSCLEKNLRNTLLAVVASLLLAGGVLAKDDFLPDTTPTAGVPVPMVSYKKSDLKTLVTSEGDALFLLEEPRRTSGEVSVRFKTTKAEGELELGLIYRYQSPQDYFRIVVSAKDESCTLYRVKGSTAKEYARNDFIVSPLAWHELRITFTPDRFTAILDGEVALGTTGSKSKIPGQLGVFMPKDAPIVWERFQVSRQ